MFIKGSTWLLAIIYFCINICDTHRYNSSNFPLPESKKKAFLYFIPMWFLSEYDYSFETVISPREGVCFVFYLCQMLMKHEHPICCSTSLEFVFSATTSLMTSAHSAIAFLPILPKWNFTKGLADRGKLNHSPPKWDASTPQLFSYRESLSSLLQKEAAIITESVPQSNPECGKQHDLCCRFLSHIWSALELIFRLSKVGLVLCDIC